MCVFTAFIATPIIITNVGKDVYFQDIIDETNPALSAIRLATLQEFLEQISTFVETLPICCRASTHTTCQLALIASFGNSEYFDLTQGYHRDFGGNF